MANRQFHLSQDDLQQLQQRERDTRDVKEAKRLQAVRLYGTRQPTALIQTVVGCSEGTVWKWVRRYQQAGIGGLATGGRGNECAAKLTRAQRAGVRVRLHQQCPHEVLAVSAEQSVGQYWSVATVREAVALWYGVRFRSVTSYRALLKAAGFSLQQPETAYRSRADATTVTAFKTGIKKP